jgi:hypothetical protein
MRTAEDGKAKEETMSQASELVKRLQWFMAAVFCATAVLAPNARAATCETDAQTACLIGGRYKVTSHWKNQYAGGQVSTLNATKRTDATAAFWLYDADTYEYMIRINTATDNGRAWISILTFTDVEFWVAVTDTTSGQYFEYHSPAGNRTLIYDPYFFVYP